MAMIRVIAGHKSHCTKVLEQIEEHLRERELDFHQLKIWKAQLERKVTTLRDLYDKRVSEAEGKEVDDLICEQAEYEDRLQSAIIKIKERLEKHQPKDSQPNKVKLPTVRLPEFEGEAVEWDSFWDQFDSNIHSRSDLTEVDKLSYLKGQLKGNAKKLISGFPSEAVSYNAAVKLLRETYENKDKRLRDLAKKLIYLKVPSHNFNSLSEFRAELESNLRRLEKAGCDLEQSSWLLSTLLIEKLPELTVEKIQWKSNNDYPSLEHIRSSLLEIINNLQSKDYKKDKDEGNKKVEKPSISKSEAKLYAVKDSQGVAKNTSNVLPQPQNSSPRIKCILCEGPHLSAKCKKYEGRPERLQRIRELGRCEKCTCRHKTEDCKFKLHQCPSCRNGIHHSLFCSPGLSPGRVTQNVCTVRPTSVQEDSTALPIGSIPIIRGKKVKAASTFFDQGSQRTFISKIFADALNLKPCGQVDLKISGFVGDLESQTYDLVNFTVRSGSKFMRLQAIVMENLPKNVKMDGMEGLVRYLRDKQVNLMDPTVGNMVEVIDLLVGADQYKKIVTGLTEKFDISFLETRAGLVPYGKIPSKFRQINSEVSHSVMVSNVCSCPTEQDAKNLWELDIIGIAHEIRTPEEKFVLEDYSKTVEYHDDQYWVRLPWKVNSPFLPTNYNLALGRLNSNLKRLRSTGNIAQYDAVIRDQLQRGFIEKVEDPSVSDRTHYLPHLAVIKDSKTTPVRVVFDCSAKMNPRSNSLNDCIYTGPSLTEKLGDILLKFRTNKYAYVADISKAFLRIGLQEVDRDYTRFLWPGDPQDENSPLDTYRFKSVLFGASSSPFLLQMTLEHHLEQQKENKEEVNSIKNSLYMDNIQGTTNDESSLLKIYDVANKVMGSANMPLQEWATNSPLLNAKLLPVYSGTLKVLGLQWDTKLDTICVKDVEWGKVNSKRSLLSNVSKIYDPLGLINPLTVSLKLLVQEVWTKKLGWDEELPKEVISSWEALSAECQELSKIKFPRHVLEENSNYDLHLFTDASPKAYGVSAYITDYNSEPQLLMSKARVAPLKPKTLPQLELTAILLGARLGKYIQGTLSSINFNRTFIWTDSEVALQWVINNKSNIVYVRNRVKEIEELTTGWKFHHLATDQNPADLLTRGMKRAKFANSYLWIRGPDWLNDEETWPAQKFETSIAVKLAKVAEASDEPFVDPKKFSSWRKLLRVTKLVFQFIEKIRGNRDLHLMKPQKYWIAVTQKESYAEAFHHLKEPLKYPMPNIVKSLNIFLHDDLLRCQGRIDQANLPYHTKFPLLLPKNHHITKLIIHSIHSDIKHGGLPEVLCKLRENI